ETREQRRSNGVMKVKQEVRPFKNGLSVGPIAAGVFFRQTGRRSRPAALVEHEFAPETEPFHSSQERSQPGPVRFFTAVAGETFQPINIAAQQTQGLGVLHVNPEVPASLREIDHVERRYDDCRHVRPFLVPAYSVFIPKLSSIDTVHEEHSENATGALASGPAPSLNLHRKRRVGARRSARR